MNDEFLDLISLSAHVQRRCLDLVKSELDQLAVHDISPIQALTLVKIGHLTTSPTALVVSGWYPGTNPSYNVSKLVENGFVTRERRTADRRSSALRLTEKGHNLRRLLLALYRRQAEQVTRSAACPGDVAALAEGLHRFEEWVGCVSHTDVHGPTDAARRVVRQARRNR
jgi:DNA-binding MarR family transcriptional regulator